MWTKCLANLFTELMYPCYYILLLEVCQKLGLWGYGEAPSLLRHKLDVKVSVEGAS